MRVLLLEHTYLAQSALLMMLVLNTQITTTALAVTLHGEKTQKVIVLLKITLKGD